MRMDHRWGQRQATNLAVHVVAANGVTGAPRVVNVSLTGAYLETSASIRLHALVYLASSSRQNCAGGRRVAANVVRHDALGVGLEWCQPLTKGGHIALLLAMLADGEIEDALLAARILVAA